MSRLKRILVPLKLGPFSAHAVSYADQLSEELGMPLTLLHCYPENEYSRPFNFSAKEYGRSVIRIMEDLYKNETKKDPKKINILARSGATAELILGMSKDYAMSILSSNPVDNKFSRFIGSRSTSIAALAKCPVLIIPTDNEYSSWQNIWHIQRESIETELLEKKLKYLWLDDRQVKSISFQQKVFRSDLWKTITQFAKKPAPELEKLIQSSYANEPIDLVILFTHERDHFEKFARDEKIQVLFHFNIPVMILHTSTAKLSS